jgi:transposase InsO family protein
VRRHFTADATNVQWVADATYVPTDEGFLYLAVVLDVFSRRIIGWAMSNHLYTELMLRALDMALQQRRREDVILHSDQGCQYASIAFGRRYREAGVQPSMGTAGDAYDDAMCESFFGTLEAELLCREHFATHEQARRRLFSFAESSYNIHRPHSSIGYCSPLEFENLHARDQGLSPRGLPNAGQHRGRAGDPPPGDGQPAIQQLREGQRQIKLNCKSVR